MTNNTVPQSWKDHAYPLQQLVVQVQGTRHTDRNGLIAALQAALDQVKAGKNSGIEHDDDYGFSFTLVESQESFFFLMAPLND